MILSPGIGEQQEDKEHKIFGVPLTNTAWLDIGPTSLFVFFFTKVSI